MSNSKGFTMVELLVAGAIAAVLMATVGAVLMYSGRLSGVLTQSSAARESLYTALEMIRQDIMQAGTGLNSLDSDTESDTPTGRTQKLALYVADADKHTDSPRGWDKLYLSYSKYLKAKHATRDPGTGVLVSDCDTATNTDNPNFFCHRSWKKAGTIPSTGDPASLADGLYTNPRLGPYDVGFLIGENDNLLALTPDIDASSYDAWDGKFTFSGALTPGNYYVPAVSYECDDCGTGDTNMGALVRNGTINNKKMVIFGGDSLVRVTNFRVKLLYFDTVQARVEDEPRPRSTTDVFSPDDYNLIREIEVRIFYQVKGPDGKWTHDSDGNPVELTAVMRAVPRGLVLGQMVTSGAYISSP